MRHLPLGGNLTIAIDIDGTVADCSEVDFSKVDKDPRELLKAKPIKGAVEAVKKLVSKGHRIVFYTSRDNRSKKVTQQWLKTHGFPFDHIETEKFVAHVYIDDRAISCSSWQHVMRNIENPDLPGRIARENGQL